MSPLRAALRPVPESVDGVYPAPRAGIDPDRELSWLRRLRPVLAAHRRIFVMAMVLSVLSLLAQVEIPYVLGRAIDQLDRPDHGRLLWFGLVIVGLGLVRAVLVYGSRRLLAQTAFVVESDLRNLMYTNLMRLSPAFYETAFTGDLVSRANSDVRAIQLYLTSAPATLVGCGVAVFAFVQMLFINPLLAVVVGASIVAALLVGMQMRARLFPAGWLTQSRLAEVAGVVEENVSGVRVIMAFAQEKPQFERLLTAVARLRWANRTDARIRSFLSPLLENLPRFGTVALLLYGGFLVVDGETTIGTIVALNSYVILVQPPFRGLGLVLALGQRASAAAARVFAVLDEVPALSDGPPGASAGAGAEIVMSHVTFGYGTDEPVLRDFSLLVPAGQTVALVGRTGAGKSTVMRLLLRYYDPQAGTISIGGADLRSLALAQVRAAVGLVEDEPFLFTGTIRDNITYGDPGASDERMRAAARTAQAARFIDRLDQGYDTLVGERGYTLSGGQRQRLAIARTLLLDPPVLVLDDATSAIDVRVEAEIHAALAEVVSTRTTVIIAHRLSTVLLADRVVLLEDGQVLASGTHEELLRVDGRYREVVGLLPAPASKDATATAAEVPV